MLQIAEKARDALDYLQFQWAPTLGGECYDRMSLYAERLPATSFNGYPPLGVNATCVPYRLHDEYQIRFNGHPPLRVNATAPVALNHPWLHLVSMGTHP